MLQIQAGAHLGIIGRQPSNGKQTRDTHLPHGNNILEIGAESQPVLAQTNSVLALAHAVELLQLFLQKTPNSLLRH